MYMYICNIYVCFCVCLFMCVSLMHNLRMYVVTKTKRAMHKLAQHTRTHTLTHMYYIHVYT